MGRSPGQREGQKEEGNCFPQTELDLRAPAPQSHRCFGKAGQRKPEKREATFCRQAGGRAAAEEESLLASGRPRTERVKGGGPERSLEPRPPGGQGRGLEE